MAKKQKVTRSRRRVRKNIEKGEAHIASTFNNTMVTLTDINGNVISWASAGQLGFRGSTTNLPYKPDSSNSSILILGFSISIMGTLLLDK